MATKSDFGIGMLFSIGVSGERSLYALSSLMNAVKTSAIATSIELGVLTRAAGVFAVGLGVTILGIKAFKAALNMADEAAEFDYQLRHIAALGASFGEDMSGYGDDILDLSMKYGIAAIDIAQASKELLRAGLSPSESTTMLDPILQMSLIGEMSASDAASTMLAVVNSMKYSAEDATAIMDTLTYSANAGWIEVEDFWQGFARFGAQSLAMNQPLEETIALFMMLKETGISASRAASLLGMMFVRMQAPTPGAVAVFEELGVNLVDANGEYRDMLDIMPDITAAMASHNIDAQTAATALFGEDEMNALSMEEGQMLLKLFSQRPLLGYQTGATVSGETGLSGWEAGQIRADDIKAESPGYAATYMETIMDSYTMQKERLMRSWEAIKYKIALPMVEMLANLLESALPVVTKVYELIKANPELAKTVGSLLLIIPLLITAVGAILLIKGLSGILGAVGMANFKALITGLTTLATQATTTAATVETAATAIPAAATAGAGATVGTVLLAIASIVALVAIVKWVVEAIKFYGNDGSTFLQNTARFILNILIGVANLIIEIVLTLIGVLYANLYNFANTLVKIYNALPGSDTNLSDLGLGVTTNAQGFTTARNAREALFGDNFMEVIGYQDYAVPEQYRTDEQGYYPGQARNDNYDLSALIAATNSANNTTPASTTPVATAPAGSSIQIANVNITVTGGANGNETGQAIGAGLLGFLNIETDRSF